jgi:D-threonate/D-erythronate kinase
MPKILVIADDLTGAADCAVAFAGHGLHTVVVLGNTDTELTAEIVSVDADTRRLPPGHAAAETTRLLRRYLLDTNTILYKKIDSTMRGNIGEELAAVLEIRRERMPSPAPVVAVLAPAFPATGRTTVEGRQLLNGQPLPEPGPGQNSYTHGSFDIAAILRASHLRPVLMQLHQIRGNLDELRNTIQAIAQQADVLVCDAQSEDDLRKIADAATILGSGVVWAGSGGLARHLPMAATVGRAQQSRKFSALAVGPTLLVVGSNSAVSRQQVEALASGSSTIVISIPPDLLIAQESSMQGHACKLELERAMHSGSDVVVFADSTPQIEIAKQPLLVAGLAALVTPFAHTVGALVATGGESARAIFEAWGISSLRLVGEVESGLPFSVTSGWKRELPVITKAGGFGNRDSLLRCCQFLRELERGDAGTQRLR